MYKYPTTALMAREIRQKDKGDLAEALRTVLLWAATNSSCHLDDLSQLWSARVRAMQ